MRVAVRVSLLWVILACLAGPLGCIYTEGINEAPVIRLQADTAPPIYIGDEVVISAQGTRDPNGDSMTFQWSLEWRPLAEGGGGDIPTPADCSRFVPPDKYCFRPLAKAIYDVHLTVRDRWGARTSTPPDAPFEVVVNNRPPKARLSVITLGNEFGEFTLGSEILLWAGDSTDPDDGDVLTYAWEVAEPPASRDFVAQTLNVQMQPTGDATEAVYLRLVPDVRGIYSVTVTVSDGAGPESVDSATRDLFVREDSPPCVVGTDPDFASGALVFDRTERRRLEVTRVQDDLDPYPGGAYASFAWSVEWSQGSGFMPVVGYGFPYLDIEGADYSLGQRIRVRVRPLDRVDRPPPICPESQITCGASCFEWITWDIEFR